MLACSSVCSLSAESVPLHQSHDPCFVPWDAGIVYKQSANTQMRVFRYVEVWL